MSRCRRGTIAIDARTARRQAEAGPLHGDERQDGPAIVGYILDQGLTDPAITDMVVTSDGFVFAQGEGDDYLLRLSPKRLAELQAEMDALIERYPKPRSRRH